VTAPAARLFAYSLPLARPLAARGGAVRRDGFLLCLTDAEGRSAWGEAAPLPAHGSESPEAALAGLRRFANAGLAGPEGAEACDGRLADWLAPLALGPAARCAVEAAALGLIAAQRGLPLHRLLAPDAADRVAVAGLIGGGGDAAAVGDTAARLAADGHRTIKLKVGDQPLTTDAARVTAAAAALGSGGTLRLDANRAYGSDATAAMTAFAATGANIAFVEEPGGSAAPLPLALDETLVGLPVDAALASLGAPGLAAVVLKPMLLGFETTARLGRAARARGLDAVVSASFETTLGLRLAASLAAGLPTSAAGLGTAPWLAADLLPPEPEPAVIDLARPVPDPGPLEPLDV
jgi:o-succinylbenzoate synthase